MSSDAIDLAADYLEYGYTEPVSGICRYSSMVY